jgi:hypothetical protein
MPPFFLRYFDNSDGPHPALRALLIAAEYVDFFRVSPAHVSSIRIRIRVASIRLSSGPRCTCVANFLNSANVVHFCHLFRTLNTSSRQTCLDSRELKSVVRRVTSFCNASRSIITISVLFKQVCLREPSAGQPGYCRRQFTKFKIVEFLLRHE